MRGDRRRMGFGHRVPGHGDRRCRGCGVGLPADQRAPLCIGEMDAAALCNDGRCGLGRPGDHGCGGLRVLHKGRRPRLLLAGDRGCGSPYVALGLLGRLHPRLLPRGVDGHLPRA